MATPFSLSKDGIEMQFATNHVGMIITNPPSTWLADERVTPIYSVSLEQCSVVDIVDVSFVTQ